MVITIPMSQPRGEGLRPVDMSRDISQIVDLLRMVFKDTLDIEDRQWLGDAGQSYMPEALTRLNPAASRLANGFVWVADGRIVGNATLLPTKIWGRYLVANVAVHPSYRRHGIARELMHAVTDSVRARHGRVILLQVVKDNYPAIDLYTSLGYQSVGDMTTWYATSGRTRQISAILSSGPAPEVRPLSNRMWRAAYQLDTSCVPADLNWPEPLPPDAYRQSIFRRIGDFFGGRQMETWAITEDDNQITGLASITGEWGRVHLVSLRVAASRAGQFERPLLAKIMRRISYLPRRNIRIDHPDDDSVTNELLQEANFIAQRTLTHMRLDLSR